MFGQTKKRTPNIKPGHIVSLHHGQRYGVVQTPFQHGRRTLFPVHYIDPDTGKLMVCPDHERCGSTGHACPIHGANCTEDHLSKWTKQDVEFYVSEGMLDQELADGHLRAQGIKKQPEDL
jgi:hypothetical protein